MAARNLGLSVDFSPTSEYALKWGLEHLAREGDNVIVIFVNNCYAEDERDAFLWKDHGTPLIPLQEIAQGNVRRMYGLNWKAEVVQDMRRAAAEKHLKIGVKVYWGDPREKLCAAAKDLPLHLLIVGSTEFGRWKRAFVSSLSDYVVNNAVCPVTVVQLPEQLRAPSS